MQKYVKGISIYYTKINHICTSISFVCLPYVGQSVCLNFKLSISRYRCRYKHTFTSTSMSASISTFSMHLNLMPIEHLALY